MAASTEYLEWALCEVAGVMGAGAGDDAEAALARLTALEADAPSLAHTYAYELAVIVRDGLRRMCEEQEDVFYYLTVMNENYVQPALPDQPKNPLEPAEAVALSATLEP